MGDNKSREPSFTMPAVTDTEDDSAAVTLDWSSNGVDVGELQDKASLSLTWPGSPEGVGTIKDVACGFSTSVKGWNTGEWGCCAS